MKTEFTKNIVDSHGNTHEMLFERLTGSRLYGTSFELGEHPHWDDYESDYDYRGLYVVDPEIKLMLPPFNKYDQNIKVEEFDIEYHELNKFMLEAIKNSPNFMDLLFANDKSLVGISEKGRILLDNKHIFLSNQIGKAFKGFALSQLKRMKDHKKWFTRYPDIYDVENTLKEAYKNNHIDFDAISFNFSGSLANKLTDETANNKKVKSSMPFEEMLNIYFSKKNYDISKYMKPTIYSFLNLYSMGSGLSVKMDKNMIHYLHNDSTFKKKNESLYFVYDGEEGVLLNNRAIRHTLNKKPNLNQPIKYMLHFDFTTFKSKSSDIKDLWKWKVERNERRSQLEEKFGYDVKHAMHTYRLLDGGILTFEEGVYTPELSANRLQEAKDILAGLHTYDEIISKANEKVQKLMELSQKGIFPEFPDVRKINEIYMEVIRK
jgi:hypothetical protein